MAKNTNSRTKRLPNIQGISNYDKLRSNKSKNRYNPFISQTFNQKAKNNVEASSLDARYLDDDVYQQMLAYNNYNYNHRTGQKSSYYGLDLKMRRQRLILMSGHDIIDDVLTKLCNEVVVATNERSSIELTIKNSIFDQHKIKESYKQEVTEYAQKSYTRIVNMYGLEQLGSETSLWNKCWCFLTEGKLAYETIWNDPDNPKYIIGIHEIDALDTEPFFYNGAQYWTHHKLLGNKTEKIILFDRQVVYVDWSKAQPNNRLSYLEHLMKSFNDLRIIDEATINWAITNSTFRQMLTIPTKGLSRTQAASAVNREQTRWNDEISYDSSTGEVSVNGRSRLQMMKTIYLGEGNGGAPKLETFGGDGPDFSNMEKNMFFEKRFYKAAKMPASRFDASGGESWNIDTRSTLREEINFGRFVDKIRQILKMLILKPLRTELVFRFPELKEENLLEAFDIRWNTYNVFEELMEMDIMQEKMQFIADMNEKFTLTTPDGADMKFFSLQFLMEEYLPELNDDKRKRNAALRVLQEKELFDYQIKIHQLNAEFNPELRINDFGAPDTEGIAKATAAAVGPPQDWSNYVDDEDDDDELSGTDSTEDIVSKIKSQAKTYKPETGKDFDEVDKDIEKKLEKEHANQK